MRFFRVLVLVVAFTGCSPKPTKVQVHHILPANFSGIYVIQKGQEDSNSYKFDGKCYIFEIPERGILKVTPDTFEKYYINLGSCKSNIELTVSFPDGKAIAMYSPFSSSADSESDNLLIQYILRGRDSIWFAVGNYKQLNEFSEKYWKEVPEKLKFSEYGVLEEYLPPNTPFQTDTQASTD